MPYHPFFVAPSLVQTARECVLGVRQVTIQQWLHVGNIRGSPDMSVGIDHHRTEMFIKVCLFYPDKNPEVDPSLHPYNGQKYQKRIKNTNFR